ATLPAPWKATGGCGTTARQGTQQAREAPRPPPPPPRRTARLRGHPPARPLVVHLRTGARRGLLAGRPGMPPVPAGSRLPESLRRGGTDAGSRRPVAAGTPAPVPETGRD